MEHGLRSAQAQWLWLVDLVALSHAESSWTGIEPMSSALANRFSFLNTYFHLFIWLPQVLVAACGIFSCGMWDLVP